MRINIFILFFYFTFFQCNWHNLKVKLEYSEFINEAYNNYLSNETINFMKNNIFLVLKEYLFNSFKIKEKPEIDLTKVNEIYKLRYIYGKKLKNYDLLIKIVAVNFKNQILAQAKPIGFNYDTKRPNVGIIRINLFYIKKIKDTEKYFNNTLLTLIHETFHILGFNYSGMNKLKVKKEIIKDKINKNYIVKSPKVLKYARKQYGCKNLKSLFFENDLTPHWEVIQFGNEVEMAVSKRNLKISEMTIAFLEDLGWYKVNYNMSEILPFGLKKGCNFINNPSTKFEEFSNKKILRCSNDYLSTSYFIKNSLTNNLYVKSNMTLCSLKYKKKTSCIEIIKNNIYNPTCVESKCLIEKNKIIIKYFYKNKTIICKKNNEIIINGNYKIKCPNIDKFCDYKLECKNNCNNRGFCLNGNCICNNDYKGLACEFNNKKSINSFYLNKKCNFNGYFKDNKCNCYENYKGNYCKHIIVNRGSFGSNCKKSIYIKCYLNNYMKKRIIFLENGSNVYLFIKLYLYLTLFYYL